MQKIRPSELLKSRSGTTDLGRPYEQELPALFGIKCVFNSDIKDMWMASNIDGVGSFDDLILFIETTSGCKNLFLIQIKNKCNMLLNSKILISGSKDFGLAKYEDSFLNIKDKFDSGSLPLPYQGDFQNITFLLLTNIKLNCDDKDGDIIFNEEEEQTNISRQDSRAKEFRTLRNILNTGKIFQIHNGVKKYNDNFLKQFYLYCSQVDGSQIENKIKLEIDKHFKQLDIANSIMGYFSDWSKKKFENKTVLTKMDIQATLLETILNPYIIVPDTNDTFQKAQIWNDITNEFNGVFLKTNKHLSKVHSAIQHKIDKHLEGENININNWNNLLHNPSNIIKKVLEKLPSFLELPIRKVKNTYKVKDLIMLLWNACQLPIIINLNIDSHQQENVSNAILEFDYSESKRSYIFFGGKPFDLPYHTVFTNLEQVSNKNQLKALRDIEVSLQNRKSVSLEKLSPDSKTLREITPDIFLDLLEYQRVINKNVENDYIPRYLQKPRVSHDVVSQKDAVFVIAGIPPQIKFNFGMRSCIDWLYYENLIQPGYRQHFTRDPKSISIIAIEEIPKKYKHIIEIIEKVSEKANQTVHFFQFNGNNLEWIYSNQNINMVLPYCIRNVGEDCLLSDSDLFNYLNFNVLSDKSGEGKTMLLHYLKDNCPPDMWMIYLNVSDVSDYIIKQEFSSLRNFLYDKSNETTREHNNFFWKLFKNLLRKLKVIIAIDGLDDVKYEPNTEKFLKCIKHFGTPTLLTTRPSLQNLLENNFNTLSLYFKPFTKDNQKELIQKNINAFSEIYINQIIQKTSSLGDKLIAIPLQTELFVRIMENKNDIDITNFDISDLYDKFIEIQLNKVNSFNNSTVRTLSRLALLQFHQESKVSGLFNLPEFYDDVEDKKEKFINSRIIQRIERKSVTFAHKSLSEFLLAKYLCYLWDDTSQHNILHSLIEGLFYQEQEIIRIFFDKIILKSSPLHKAVLENNEELFKSLIKKIKFNSEDKLGRNVLHIAVAYGKCNELRMAQALSSNIKIMYSYNVKIGNEILPSNAYDRPNQISADFLRRLLKYNFNPYKKDNLFNMDVFDFAIQSSSLGALEELFAETFSNDLKTVNKDVVLYHCVKEGYWNLFKNITSKNFKLRHKVTGENLLHTSLYAANFNIVNEIINNFSNIDEPNSMGATPLLSLFHSSRSVLNENRLTLVTQSKQELNENDTNILKLFIEKKANVNATNFAGQTSLHYICLMKNMRVIIKQFLNLGADINKKTFLGETPLHYAATCSIENVRILLRKSDIDSITSSGMTPLCYAVKSGKLEILKYLIKKGASVTNNKNRISPLIEAISMGKTEFVEVLIDSGADVNETDVRGIHPLLVAVEMGYIDCIKLLICKKIPSTGICFNALYSAAKNANEKIYNYLCEVLNMYVEHENQFLLHAAVLNIDEGCIQWLLSKGFEINIKTKNGTTPLHIAAEFNLKSMLEYLISIGADVNEENNNKDTALTIAASNNSLDCLKLLVSSNCNLKKYGSEAIYMAALENYQEIIGFLLSQGVDINGQTLDDASPIECAIFEEELECLKILLLNGADINLKGLDGKTPILHAAEEEDSTILKYLLSHGADLNVKDNDGNSVLHTAVCSRYTENVKAVLEKNVNVHEVNNAGETPIDIAQKNGCNKIKRLLLKNHSEIHKNV